VFARLLVQSMSFTDDFQMVQVLVALCPGPISPRPHLLGQVAKPCQHLFPL
jgi:hypothetical protein